MHGISVHISVRQCEWVVGRSVEEYEEARPAGNGKIKMRPTLVLLLFCSIKFQLHRRYILFFASHFRPRFSCLLWCLLTIIKRGTRKHLKNIQCRVVVWSWLVEGLQVTINSIPILFKDDVSRCGIYILKEFVGTDVIPQLVLIQCYLIVCKPLKKGKSLNQRYF